MLFLKGNVLSYTYMFLSGMFLKLDGVGEAMSSTNSAVDSLRPHRLAKPIVNYRHALQNMKEYQLELS